MVVSSVESIENEAFTVKHRKVDVEIGNRKTKGFKPHFKLKRWDGECSLSLSFDDSKIKLKDKKVKVEGSKVKWETPDLDFHYYPIEPRVELLTVNDKVHDFLQNDEGGFEWEIILKKKPPTNILAFPIQTEGLTFHYQPPIHPDHPTWGDDDGDGIPDNFRPENVVGSYAVEHATRTSMHASAEDAEKYKCGIAFHIYYPYLVDAEGWKVRAEDFNISDGYMTITLPQDFLDSAVYPIVVDPTFGYTIVGGSYGSIQDDYISWYDLGYSPASGGTADSISVHCIGAGHYVEMGLYEKTGDRTGSRVGDTEPAAIGGSWAWYTGLFAIPPSVSPATPYLLVFNKDVDTSFKYNINYEEDSAYESEPYGSWPATISGVSWDNRKFSIYCTYTAGAQTIEKTYDVDTLFRRLGIEKTPTIDAAFQRKDIQKTADIDALIVLHTDLQKQFDAVFQREFDKGRRFDFIADGIDERSLNPLASKLISNFGQCHGIAQYGDYLYLCSRDALGVGKVAKVHKTDYDDLTVVAIPGCSAIPDIIEEGGYIWVVDYNELFKLDPSDLSTVASYTFPAVDLRYSQALTSDANYIYISGWNGVVVKMEISTGDYIYTTLSGANYLHTMSSDANYLYPIGAASPFRCFKLLKTNLSVVGYADIGHQTSDDTCNDDDYVYVATEDPQGVMIRVKKSDMTFVVHWTGGMGMSHGNFRILTHLINVEANQKLWLYNTNGFTMYKTIELNVGTDVSETCYDGTYMHISMWSQSGSYTYLYRFNAEEILKDTYQRFLNLDAWFKAIVEETADFDAIFKRYGVERIAAVDAFLVLSFEFLRQFDAYFKAIGVERPAKVDAWFKRFDIEKAAAVDTALQRKDIGASIDIDTVFIVRMTLQRQLDAYFKVHGVERPAALDAAFRALDIEKTLDVDTLFRRLGIGKDATIDVLFRQLTIPITTAMDAYFKILGVEKTAPMDVLFRKLDIPKIALLDAIFATPIERAMALDAIFFRGDILRTLLIDAAFQKQGIGKTADVDALIVLHTEPPLPLDAVFFGQDVARSFGIDATFGFWRFIFVSTYLTSDEVKANLTDEEVETDLTPTDVKARLG